MEELIRVAKQHFESQQDIDSKTLAGLINNANADSNFESAAPDVLNMAMGFLTDGEVSYHAIYDLLNKLFPTCFSRKGGDQETAEPTKMSPLDSRSRTSKLNFGRSAHGSAAEGARLRQRQFGAANDAEMDEQANSCRNEVLGSINAYETQRQRTTPTRRTTFTESDYPFGRRLSHSDPNASGFETPNVSRTAIRHHINAGSGMSPLHNMYESPQGISSPFDGSSVSGLDFSSPSHLPGTNESAEKTITRLSRQKEKLKKELDENKNRIQINSEKHEREVTQLRNKIDEISAELSQKRREIEKYKAAEKSHVQAMDKTEESMSRLGVDLSNSQRLSSQLKHELDRKTELLGAAEQRIFNKEAQIRNLMSAVDTHEKSVSELKSQVRELEFQMIELSNELEVAREYQERSLELERENIGLSETIADLNAQIGDLRRQMNSAAATRADEAEHSGAINGAEKRTDSNRSLFEELETNGSYDLSGVDDAVYGKVASRSRGQSVPSSLASTSVSPTAGMGHFYDSEKRLMQEWVPYALKHFSSEDWFVLREMWKRAERCDKGADEQEQLRNELLAMLMASTKVGFKEAIRGQSNPKLRRIAENVAGKYKSSAGAAESRVTTGNKSGGASGNGLSKLLASGQHTTAVIILYSVVVFCLGIITASFFNVAQPMASTSSSSSSSLPYGANNSSMHVPKHPGDGGIGMVRQLLVVDDMPAPKHYMPLHGRAPRSKLTEILFYWMETLLWEDGNYQVPT